MNKSKVKSFGYALGVAIVSGLAIHFILKQGELLTVDTIKDKVKSNALQQLDSDIDLASEGVPVPNIDTL